MLRATIFVGWITVGVALLLLSTGCGGDSEPTYVISGTVTSSDGVPLAQGTIRFIDMAAGTFEIISIVDGKYSGKLTVGPKRVVLNDLRDPPSGPALIFGEPLKIDYISPKFNRDSTVTCEVGPNDDNVFDVVVDVLSDREAEKGLPNIPQEIDPEGDAS